MVSYFFLDSLHIPHFYDHNACYPDTPTVSAFAEPPPSEREASFSLNINIDGVLCVALDPFLTGLYLLTHEHGKDLVGKTGIFQSNSA